MAITFSRADLISYFQTGDAPSQAHFTALIDSMQILDESVTIKEASLTIATADVLTLNSVPIEIVAAPGAGFAIEVLSASMKIVFNSVAYATNTDIDLKINTLSDGLFTTDISQNASIITNLEDAGSSGSATSVENEALMVSVRSGNPTAGDSDIKIYVTYRIITL